MTTVKRRTIPSKKSSTRRSRLSKKSSTRRSKRISLKSGRRRNRSSSGRVKRHTKRNKSKQHGGVGERDATKRAISAMRAPPTYGEEVFKMRIGNVSDGRKGDCGTKLLIKKHINAVIIQKRDDGTGGEYLSDKPIDSVVRSLSKTPLAEIESMNHDEIIGKYKEWRDLEADRRKTLRKNKKQGIVEPMKPKMRMVPISNSESTAAHAAALAMLELDKEIDADAMREMQECNLDESQDMNYTDPPPTITVDTIPSGFTPSKVKPVDDESIKTNPKSLFDGPRSSWTLSGKNDNMNEWSLPSPGAADEEDQFMQLMEMGDDMDIGVPPITKST